MGGIRESFFTTHWSLVDKVKQQGDRDIALIGLLLERYWKPVYCYLRRKGYDNEQAKDLTQGFFHEVVLNRHLVERADPAKGSFRSLLLHALHQYMIDERRRENTLKRIPKNKLVSIDIDNPPELPDQNCELDPEESFNYAWKIDLLERALAEVKENYVAQGLATHWHVFHDRLLQPVLDDHPSPSLQEICSRYGIADEARASHMLDTVKRHFEKVLRKHVRITVGTNRGVEEELEEFFKFLQK
jgi:RNA polymerase sigma-70 factor (ECF subfamily)